MLYARGETPSTPVPHNASHSPQTDRRLLLAILAAAALSGCGDDAGPVRLDAGADARHRDAAGADSGITDSQRDGPADQGKTDDARVDAPGADGTLSDAPPDGPIADAPEPDGPGVPHETVFYSANSTSTIKYTFYRARVDGTRRGAVNNLKPNQDIDTLNLNTGFGPTDVRTDQPVQRNDSGEYHIALPGRSALFRFYDATDDRLVLIKPNTTLQVLSTASGKNGHQANIAVTRDGTRAAVVKADKRVLLVRLDGTNWPGGSPPSPVVDVAPATNWTVERVIPRSLTFTEKNLYFITQDTTTFSGDRTLYRAPLDGSATATEVTLPNVGSSPANHVLDPMVASADGRYLAMIARSATTVEDVLVLNDGGTPINVSKIGTDLNSPTTDFIDNLQPNVALSSTGTYVVYSSLATSTGKGKCWVAKTDGSSAVEISTGTNFVRTASFSTDVDTYGAFYWASDTDLLLWAGTTTLKADLFRYSASTTKLSNLTKTGTASAAPWDSGLLEPDGGWISPNGLFLYFVGYEAFTASNLMAVNLKTFAKHDITTGHAINSESQLHDDMEAVPGTSLIAFVSHKGSVSPTVEDVYVFDQASGDPASLKNLTQHATGSSLFITHLGASPNGKWISYTTGTSSSTSSNARSLFAIPTTGGTATQLDPTTQTYEAAYVWASDSRGVIYGAGSSLSQLDLFYAPTTGTGPLTLHDAQSYLHIMRSGQ